MRDRSDARRIIVCELRAAQAPAFSPDGTLALLLDQNGNNFRNSSSPTRAPYSQSSKVSANFTALPCSGPYHLMSRSRYLSASLPCLAPQRRRSQALRATSSVAAGTVFTYSSLPLAPPS